MSHTPAIMAQIALAQWHFLARLDDFESTTMKDVYQVEIDMGAPYPLSLDWQLPPEFSQFDMHINKESAQALGFALENKRRFATCYARQNLEKPPESSAFSPDLVGVTVYRLQKFCRVVLQFQSLDIMRDLAPWLDTVRRVALAHVKSPIGAIIIQSPAVRVNLPNSIYSLPYVSNPIIRLRDLPKGTASVIRARLRRLFETPRSDETVADAKRRKFLDSALIGDRRSALHREAWKDY